MMASYFGEIIEPTTRAIFDDFSDDEEIPADPAIQTSWVDGTENIPTVLDVIFIFHGRLSLAFAEAFLLDENQPHQVEIKISENVSEEDYHPKNLSTKLYFNNGKGICLVSPTFSSQLGYLFTEAICSFLKISKKVIVFTNESWYNYKALSLNDLPPAFVREIKTNYNNSKDGAEKLPTPNFITGIPAGVISWCQIFEKDGSAFIIYSDQEKLDSITATPFLSVIKNLGFNIIKNSNPNFNGKSYYGKPEIIGGSSNIYI